VFSFSCSSVGACGCSASGLLGSLIPLLGCLVGNQQQIVAYQRSTTQLLLHPSASITIACQSLPSNDEVRSSSTSRLIVTHHTASLSIVSTTYHPTHHLGVTSVATVAICVTYVDRWIQAGAQKASRKSQNMMTVRINSQSIPTTRHLLSSPSNQPSPHHQLPLIHSTTQIHCITSSSSTTITRTTTTTRTTTATRTTTSSDCSDRRHSATLYCLLGY
jgi:hypothetical protein